MPGSSLVPSPRRWWLLLPALTPALLVVTGTVASLALASVGLMPLVGTPRLEADAYRAVSSDLATATSLTLALAAAATLVAAVVGLVTAVLVSSFGPGSRWLGLTAAATVPVPHLVGAAAVGLLLADSGVLPRLLGLSSTQWPDLVAGPWWVAVVAEYAWKESAFIALVVSAVISTRANNYDETAALLGAGRSYRFVHVTLPLALPALLLSAAISFVYVVGSYEVSWLLGRTYPEPLAVLAFRLYSSPELSARPSAAAAAVVTTAVAAVAAMVVAAASRRLTASSRLGSQVGSQVDSQVGG